MPPGRTIRTAKNRERFLDLLSQGWSVTYAAKKIRSARRSLYDWRDADPDFAKAWDAAWDSGGDWYEDKNRKEAAKGNMTAIFNGLRIHKRLVDRTEHTGPAGGPIPVIYLPAKKGKR